MAAEVHAHLGKLARGGTLGLAGAIVSAAAGFGLVVIITNGFDKATAGVLFSATSVFVIALSLSTLGTDVGLGRFLLRYAAEQRSDAIRLSIRTALRAVVVASLLIAVTLGLAAPGLANILGLDGPGGTLVLIILVLALPPSAIGSVALASTRAFGTMRPTVLVDYVGRSVLQPILVGICVLLGTGIVFLTAAWVVPYVICAVVSCIVLYRLVQKRAPRSDLFVPDSRDVVRGFWAFTWPRAIGSVSQILIQRADIIIVAALISPSAAAVYTAATRFVALGKFGLQAIQQVLQPQITHLLATHQHDVLRDLFKIATAWNVAIAWPLYLAVGAAPAVYLSVFGNGFAAQGTSTVIVMSLGMLLAVFSGPVDTVLLMAGRSTASLVNSLIALAVDIGLCFLLIPRLGIAGAAVAWAAALAVRAGLSYVQVYRTLKITPLSKASLLAGSAAVLCFALPMLGLTVLGWANLPSFIVTGLVGTGAYLGMLWLARKPLHLQALRSLRQSRTKELTSADVG